MGTFVPVGCDNSISGFYLCYTAFRITENAARKRLTFQSSVHNIGYSSNAVDGNLSPRYNAGSCTETNYEQNPWWAVELDDVMNVIQVDIVNRQDCCCEDYQIVNQKQNCFF